jgi:hypothetical protein
VFNTNKSLGSKFGTKWSSNTVALLLDISCLQSVGSFRYLGVMFISGASLAVDCCFIKRKFHAAYNSISSGCKCANELVELHLIKSHCLPPLMYCIGATDLPKYEIKDLSVSLPAMRRSIWQFFSSRFDAHEA